MKKRMFSMLLVMSMALAVPHNNMAVQAAGAGLTGQITVGEEEAIGEEHAEQTAMEEEAIGDEAAEKIAAALEYADAAEQDSIIESDASEAEGEAERQYRLAAQAEVSTEYRHSGSLQMNKLSQQEILQLLKDNSLELPSQMFDVVPSCTAPYSTGQVKNEAIQVAVNRLNALRRIAGLPEVAADTGLSQQAQYGAVLLATKGVTFGHYPARPADMEEVFYQEAVSATSSSNIYGGVTLSKSVDGFMDDSDASNVSRLGHRRWQLNPTMGKIGFGYAENTASTYKRYVTEKVFDRSGAGCDYDFISWPASGNFPASQFQENVAWSVTLNPEKYQIPKASELTIVLSRQSDGTVWTFDGSKTYTPSASGEFFALDKGGYGVSNCIIFRPDSIKTSDGKEIYDGVYTVRIYGLKDSKGNAVEMAYQVDFFTTAKEESVSLTDNMFIVDTSAEVYDGTAKTKRIATTLVENVDYTITYANNVNAGTATIYLTGMGKYTGQLIKNFTIQKAQRQISISVLQPVMYLYEANNNKVVVVADNAASEAPVYQYSTTNSSIADITATGMIIPMGQGNATIIVKAEETANYVSGSAMAPVTVKYPKVNVSQTFNGKIVSGVTNAYVQQIVTFRVEPDEGYWASKVSVTDGNGKSLALQNDGRGNYSFTMPSSDVTIWATFKITIPAHACYLTHFIDVDLTEWYHSALDFVVVEEMMSGTSANTFEPDTYLTRAMLAQVLYNREGTPQVKKGTLFPDVPANAWYADAVNWAASVGIVSGYPEGGFGPEDYITREQVAVVLKLYGEYKAYDVSAQGSLAQYTDGNKTHVWAREAMEWAIGAKVMNGKSNTLLDPLATATRAEVAQMLSNFCEEIADAAEDGAEAQVNS